MDSHTAVPDPIPKYALYGEPLVDTGERFVHVESIAARSRAHDWRIRPHAHRDLHHLLLIGRGGGVLSSDEGDRGFAAPVLIRVPSAWVHGFEFTPGTEGWVVTVSDALLGRITTRHPELPTSGSAASVLALPPGSTAARRLRRALAELIREFRASLPGRQAALEAALVALHVGALRVGREGGEAVIERQGDARLVSRFQRLIEANFRTRLRVTGYARQLAVSRERLRQACQRVAGCSPARLLQQRRLLEARRGLLYTGLTVAQVAAESGFDDPAYFSRQFARLTGESPRAFRQRRSAGANVRGD